MVNGEVAKVDWRQERDRGAVATETGRGAQGWRVRWNFDSLFSHRQLLGFNRHTMWLDTGASVTPAQEATDLAILQGLNATYVRCV